MKNVAKCDTWCELQNPVNHRVFERKLRPRPLGRGHACLGVTPPIATPPRHSHAAPGGAETGRPCPSPRRAVGGKRRTPCGATRRVGVERRLVADRTSRPHSAARCRPRDQTRPQPRALGPRPQVRRGHPLNLSISISGGEETYEDSPSNGERTGSSPA